MSAELKRGLIIFAKRPVPGRVKTRLTPPLSPEQAAGLYRCMLEDILDKATALPGVEKRIFYEPDRGAPAFFAGIAPALACTPQSGADLGERMANAFAELFALGYGGVAIIGSDLPDLPPGYVEEAFRRLADPETDAVFGPAEDGGYYLIAMRQLHGKLFRDIPWSSGAVLARSLERARESGIRVALLPPWHDADTAGDLCRPELMDGKNGAPLTRAFIGDWLKGSPQPSPVKEGP